MFTTKALRDIAERVFSTAAQAFLAVYGLNAADVTNLSLAQQGGLAAASAVLALLKSAVATRAGSSRDDGSLL